MSHQGWSLNCSFRRTSVVIISFSAVMAEAASNRYWSLEKLPIDSFSITASGICSNSSLSITRHLLLSSSANLMNLRIRPTISSWVWKWFLIRMVLLHKSEKARPRSGLWHLLFATQPPHLSLRSSDERILTSSGLISPWATFSKSACTKCSLCVETKNCRSLSLLTMSTKAPDNLRTMLGWRWISGSSMQMNFLPVWKVLASMVTSWLVPEPSLTRKLVCPVFVFFCQKAK